MIQSWENLVTDRQTDRDFEGYCPTNVERSTLLYKKYFKKMRKSFHFILTKLKCSILSKLFSTNLTASGGPGNPLVYWSIFGNAWRHFTTKSPESLSADNPDKIIWHTDWPRVFRAINLFLPMQQWAELDKITILPNHQAPPVYRIIKLWYYENKNGKKAYKCMDRD